MNIGRFIRELRNGANVNQMEFSKVLGITQPYLCLIETKGRIPSMGILKKVSNYFDVSIAYILLNSLEETDLKTKNKIANEELIPFILNLIKNLQGK